MASETDNSCNQYFCSEHSFSIIFFLCVSHKPIRFSKESLALEKTPTYTCCRSGHRVFKDYKPTFPNYLRNVQCWLIYAYLLRLKNKKPGSLLPCHIVCSPFCAIITYSLPHKRPAVSCVYKLHLNPWIVLSFSYLEVDGELLDGATKPLYQHKNTSRLSGAYFSKLLVFKI